MEILRRLPLTLATFVSFGAFSLASTGIRTLINYYYSRKRLISTIEIIGTEIPDDMWNEIFRLTDATDAELLTLSLVNKQWNKRVDSFYASFLQQTQELHGALTSKRMYFLQGYKRRIDDPIPQPVCFISTIPDDVDPHYGPWIDHNVLRHPENYWRFMKALFLKPSWIYSILAKRNRIDQLIVDESNKRRVLKYVRLTSVLFSYFPYLDTLIYNYRTNIPEAALTSTTNLFGYIWNNEPMNIITQLCIVTQLILFQPWDHVFFNDSEGVLVRLGLLIPYMFMNGGLMRLLIFAGIMALCYFIRMFRRKFRVSELIAVIILFGAGLYLYLVPAAFVLVGFVIVAINTLWEFRRGKGPTSLTWMKLAGVILFCAVGLTQALVFIPDFLI